MNDMILKISTKKLIKCDKVWITICIVSPILIALMIMMNEDLTIAQTIAIAIFVAIIFVIKGGGSRILYGYMISEDKVVLKCFYTYFFKRTLCVPKEQLMVKVRHQSNKYSIEFFDKRKIIFAKVAFTQYSSSKWEPSFWSEKEIEELIYVLERHKYNIEPM